MIKNKLQLVGCACITLMCIACDQPSGTENDNETGTTQKPHETLPQDKQVDSNISPNNKHAKYAAAQTKIVIPETCAQIPSKNACDKTLGCTFKGKCQEDTSLTTTLCGPKGMKECLESEECNYSDLIGKCFDKNVVKGKPDAPTTCAEIDETFSDSEAKKECNRTIGCKHTNGKCEENKSLTMAHCKGKSEQSCRNEPTCTWESRLQKCFLEATAILPNWNNCTEVPVAKCPTLFGCEVNGAACRDKNLTVLANHGDCNAHGDADTCNADVRCRFSDIRNACFDTGVVLRTGIRGCAEIPLDICDTAFGCRQNGAHDACENDALNGRPNHAACNIYAANANACNSDARCQFSDVRATCFAKGIALATGMAGCADIPLDVCDNVFGCQQNGGHNACENTALNGRPNHAACSIHADADTCNGDARCQFSDVRDACFAKGIALATGMLKCADIPFDVCASIFGCAQNVGGGGGGTCEDAPLVTNAPCNGFHANEVGCRAAGCVYNRFVARPAAVAGTLGACLDPSAGYRPAGFCHLRSPDALKAFCETQNGNQVNCHGLSIGVVNNVCVHEEVAEACAPIGGGNGDAVCGTLEATLRANGINNDVQLQAACLAVRVLKRDRSDEGAPCRWDGGDNHCKKAMPGGLGLGLAFHNNLLYSPGGGGVNGAQNYCDAMMNHAIDAADRKRACEGLSTIRTADANSASIQGTPLCTYTKPVAGACKPNPTNANALCAGLAEGNGVGACQDATQRHGAANAANTDVCAWTAH
ncbi:MAG: hypothetical protein AAF320_05925 [Myxococcota bacterium]